MERLPNRDRGIIPYDIRMWIIEQYGEGSFEAMLERLSPRAKAMLSNPFSKEWYPSALMQEVYDIVDDIFTPQDPDALVSLGRFMANHGIRGIIKLFVSLISVKTIIWRIDTLWNYYHKGGSVEVPIVREEGRHREGLMIVKDYYAGKGWCRLMAGYVETVIMATGAKNVTCETQNCIEKGDEDCSWLVSWDE
jgi:hypothetical protein